MKKVLDKRTVAHFWAHQTQEEGRTPTNNFKFDGKELASYGTSIGYHFGEFVLLSRDGFSPTTRVQLSLAARAASHLKRITSGIFSYGNRYTGEPTSTLIIQDQEEHLEKLYADLLKPRIRVTTKGAIASAIHHTADTINYLINHFKVNRPLVKLHGDLDKLIADSKATLERITAEKAAAAKKAEQAARRKNAKQLKAWLNGETSFLPYGLQSFNGSHLLTVRDGEVLTSQGATAPLLHVARALDFYHSRREEPLHKTSCPAQGYNSAWFGEISFSDVKKCNCGGGPDTFKPWQTNSHKIPLGVFTLDSIDEQGTVKAGCHTFTNSEILRFANRWTGVIKSAKEAEQASIESLYKELKGE